MAAHYKYHNDCHASVLTYEQVRRLDRVMDQVVPIHGRGHFPTLYVTLKRLIPLLRHRLQARHNICIGDVCLSGGCASFVLAPENSHYNDLDLIFSTDLSNQDQFDVIREAVLECLRDFLPGSPAQQQMPRDAAASSSNQQQQQQQQQQDDQQQPAPAKSGPQLSNCALKEAYVHKMVKVNDDDRWSLISLGVQQSNQQAASGQQQQPAPPPTSYPQEATHHHQQPLLVPHHHHHQQPQEPYYQQHQFPNSIELKFVDRMRRKFEFSVDSFQIILDSLIQFYDYAPQSAAAALLPFPSDANKAAATSLPPPPPTPPMAATGCAGSVDAELAPPLQPNQVQAGGGGGGEGEREAATGTAAGALEASGRRETGFTTTNNNEPRNDNHQTQQRLRAETTQIEASANKPPSAAAGAATANHHHHDGNASDGDQAAPATDYYYHRHRNNNNQQLAGQEVAPATAPANSPSTAASIASSSGCSSSSSVVSSCASSLACDEDQEDLYCDPDSLPPSPASSSSLLCSATSSLILTPVGCELALLDAAAAAAAVEAAAAAAAASSSDADGSQAEEAEVDGLSQHQIELSPEHQVPLAHHELATRIECFSSELSAAPSSVGSLSSYEHQHHHQVHSMAWNDEPAVASEPSPPCPGISENFYPTVICRSEYGNFKEALYHLEKKLIATRSPEEIRGGGLLKYCNLLVKNYKPTNVYQIRTLERYMCSRFFIDFSELNQQQAKLESYLANHFSDDPALKFDYLTILHNVVQRSTVCLMNHELRLTLNMIRELAYKQNEMQQHHQHHHQQQQQQAALAAAAATSTPEPPTGATAAVSQQTSSLPDQELQLLSPSHQIHLTSELAAATAAAPQSPPQQQHNHHNQQPHHNQHHQQQQQQHHHNNHQHHQQQQQHLHQAAHYYQPQKPVLIQSGVYRVKLVNYTLSKPVKP